MRPGQWQITTLAGMPYLSVMNEIIENAWRPTHFSSRSIKRPMTEEEFEELKTTKMQEFKARQARRLQAQAQALFESQFQLYRGSWVHSPILSWKIYSDVDRKENESSIDKQLQDIQRIRREQRYGGLRWNAVPAPRNYMVRF